MKWLDNKDSVSKEELKSNIDAISGYASDATYAAAAACDAATYTDASSIANYTDAAEKWVNKYFERTGEDKQKYINAIKEDYDLLLYKYEQEKALNKQLMHELAEVYENYNINNEFFGDQLMTLNAELARLKQKIRRKGAH